MKKLYSLVALVLLTCSTSFGQVEIKLWDSGTQTGIGNALNGQEYTIMTTTDGTHGVTINFKNTGSVNKTWKMERYRITDMAAWTDYLCWGAPGDPFGQCYTAQIMNTNPWTSPNQYSLDVAPGGSANLVADADTQGGGTEKYRFYLIEGQSTRVDSVDVIVTSTLGITDQKQEEVSIAVYPNPVANNLVIAANGLDGAFDVKMTDVLGKVVLNESSSQAKKVLDVSDFKNGVYLVSVFNKGELIQTRRIVVKH